MIKTPVASSVGTRKSIKEFFNVQNICTLSMMSALSFILYQFVKLPAFPFFPSFLQINFSSIPILLATFMLGLPGGLTTVLIRSLLALPFGDGNAYIGALADFIMGIAIVIPTWLVYSRLQTRKGALMAMGLATVVGTIVAMLVNRFFLIPLYVEVFFGGDWDILLGMVRPLYTNITIDNFYSIYLWAAVLPFNLMWLIPCSLVVFFIYKPLEHLLKNIQNRQKNVNKDEIYGNMDADA